VNLASVTDTASLATAVNNAIQAAMVTGNSALKAANIVAQIHNRRRRPSAVAIQLGKHGFPGDGHRRDRQRLSWATSR